ncbi:hypothetical protein OG725_36610 (plasmid) [Streptomyces sp. NBC_01213]|uniref:hypothetical protein n=1 Tax=Streptomyces sp. NBC_01213 TaxID=2903776 RepID=UPI002F90DE0D|nr:hypothetical protein OG725_36610 [Streptomyces sp. NBC_01213]
MTKFPSGPFTIVNQETGRCLRVRLGETVDLSDYKEGTKYLLSRTYPPSLELGPADGTKATAWYRRYHDDSLERQPFNQIASSAVSDLQNIGDYGVWMYSDPVAEEIENARLRKWFASKLNDATGDVAKRLHALIPEEWTTQAAQDYEADLARWKRRGEQFAGTVESLNGRQAALLEELRPLHGKLLEELKGQVGDLAEAIRAKGHMTINGEPPTKEALQEFMERVLLRGAAYVQHLEWEMERAERRDQADLLRKQVQVMEGSGAAGLTQRLRGLELTAPLQKAFEEARSTERALVMALEAEAPVRAWQRRAPLKGVARWNDRCARLAFYGEDKLKSVDKTFAEAMSAYLDAAARDGITKPVSTVGSRTEMFGCGAKRYENSTYRWDYDGTYITASDSQTVPWERTYWTDDDGRLVGKAKGCPGQKWTIAPYKEPAKTPDVPDLFLTGMFGPLASILRLV